MTSAQIVSEQASINNDNDLPRPDAIPDSAAPSKATALPRPLSNIHDTGRIRFGGSFRLPAAR